MQQMLTACEDAGLCGNMDPDGDGLESDFDNCPDIFNPDQADEDGDAIGDVCDDCHNFSGDINDDLSIDIFDIITLVQIILTGGWNSPDYLDCQKADADFNARTFPKLISYLGITVSFLTLVLSKNEDEPLGQYEWLKVFILFVLVFTYGIIIKSIGFFLSTNLFLLLSYYYLGVRNYKVLLLCSLPVVAVLQFMLHVLLNVYIRDPFLKLLGIIS